MQALILAAGMGKRLGKYTQNNTKCMLSINGCTLIERALEALSRAGIRKCVIVAGYEKDNLIKFVGNSYKDIEIVWVINEIYDKTNNIYSLYIAKDHLLADDTVLLESDLIFEERVIRELLENPEPTLAVVAPFESWMDGTVTQISKDNVITGFIPKKFFKYGERETYYKTVNIYKFSRDFLRDCYVPFLEAYIKTMGRNEYYEQVLRVIAAIDKNELKAMVLSDHLWYEIDDVQDKDIAESIFAESAEERLKRIAERYGGYWRFPKLLDFCYLVNPYFPPEQMRNEMTAYFDELLTEYPSGLNVQNLLAAKMFNLERDNVLTGNGAAELISALSTALGGIGRFGVIYPTFNEYPERFCKNRELVKFFPKNLPENLSYGLDDLLEFSQKCDTLLLINPDNPSGNYVKFGDVVKLLEKMKSENKTLVLDESFIDFCGAEPDTTFLKQDILDEFPNFVVIKSLSKSYGIPGIRLGVLASSDKRIIAETRKNISIWNINSFAEYFLQIIGKYAGDYKAACGKIIAERERFAAALRQTGLFDVYPSQANYLCCRIKAEKITSADLAKFLLEKRLIFIKDLTGKNGFESPNFIRVAVRGEDDNNALISALEEYITETKC